MSLSRYPCTIRRHPEWSTVCRLFFNSLSGDEHFTSGWYRKVRSLNPLAGGRSAIYQSTGTEADISVEMGNCVTRWRLRIPEWYLARPAARCRDTMSLWRGEKE